MSLLRCRQNNLLYLLSALRSSELPHAAHECRSAQYQDGRRAMCIRLGLLSAPCYQILQNLDMRFAGTTKFQGALGQIYQLKMNPSRSSNETIRRQTAHKALKQLELASTARHRSLWCPGIGCVPGKGCVCPCACRPHPSLQCCVHHPCRLP